MQKNTSASNAKYLLSGEESHRLLFRTVNENDFENWLEFCRFPDSLKYIMPGKNLRLDPEILCRQWFDKVFYRYSNGLGGMNALIDKTSMEFVGQSGLLVQTIDGVDELEIAYSIMPKYRNMGYAKEAASLCRDYAFKEGFADSLISIVHPENLFSAKVAIAIGMKLEKQSTHQDETVNIFRIHH